MAEQENGSSPLAEALAKVGDRWRLLVVGALPGGPQQLNDLLGQIPGIAANILSERPQAAGAGRAADGPALLGAAASGRLPADRRGHQTRPGAAPAGARGPSMPTRLVPRLAPRRPSCERRFTGGAPGARTLNPRIKSGLADRTRRSTCADATRGRTESTHCTGCGRYSSHESSDGIQALAREIRHSK